MYRVWYSTESFADYIINHTNLSNQPNIIKTKLYESDANNPTRFHTTAVLKNAGRRTNDED